MMKTAIDNLKWEPATLHWMELHRLIQEKLKCLPKKN